MHSSWNVSSQSIWKQIVAMHHDQATSMHFLQKFQEVPLRLKLL